MRHKKVFGIVIKRRNVFEADRIITVLTQDDGKIQILAKGVRKITSSRAPHIELLNHVYLSLYKNSSMFYLTEAETISHYQPIKMDLKKIGIVFHICELIDGLCAENQENRKIFFLLKELLEKMSLGIENIVKIVHKFEMDLIESLGFYSDQDLTGSKVSFFIESILERKLKSRQILPHLL